MHDKVCQNCGAAFQAKRSIDRWCSRRCAGRGLYWRSPERFRQKAKIWAQKNAEPKPKLYCLQCGKSMIGRRADAKWCSRRCGHHAAAGRAEAEFMGKTCAECGGPFCSRFAATCFCSVACRQRSRRRAAKIKNPKFLFCGLCGTQFTMQRGKVKYCDPCKPIARMAAHNSASARYRIKPEAQEMARLRYNEGKSATAFLTSAQAVINFNEGGTSRG